ncbi:hypothetical protein [Bacillus sp. NEB1478]|uniref:hypothetical protein n=1 Tax=Bacillus sp. NEB1478 TaxID=3073816 RepID=UPI002873995B|nr:hypothetical protein [Bacillus sp. NEB1478]WNB90939.1 hypothetical protein RGB74_13605 [Bacillus sp. NEB1478]
MKDYLIRLFFGILAFGIYFGVKLILHKEVRVDFFFVPVMIAGGWGGSRLYKYFQNKNVVLK